MIIEIFGPPGAGKTTFARALTARLQEHGGVIELILSARPAEHVSTPDTGAKSTGRPKQAAVMHRLIRPVTEMLRVVLCPFAADVWMTAHLMRTLPPRSAVWTVRLSQYILRLTHSWRRAARAEHIVLFDQAFVQSIHSLALLGRVVDDARIMHALDAIPKSDILILLDAPRCILENRLVTREKLQSTIERMFELDLPTNLKSAGIIEQLRQLLQKSGRTVIFAASLDSQSLSESLEKIEVQVATTVMRRHRVKP